MSWRCICIVVHAETVLSDEDREQDPDRWCSHSACGQELWQIISQWIWNLRLELGHQLEPEPIRTTEFAAAVSQADGKQPGEQGYAQPVIGGSWKAGRFSGEDFALQPDGTVCCPAGESLHAPGAASRSRWEPTRRVRS
jgi:hypothetical protein